jgi:hypothetical protein
MLMLRESRGGGAIAASRQLSFTIFSNSPVHESVGEHPELVIPYVLFRELV